MIEHITDYEVEQIPALMERLGIENDSKDEDFDICSELSDYWFDCDYVKLNGEDGRGSQMFFIVKDVDGKDYAVHYNDPDSETIALIDWFLNGADGDLIGEDGLENNWNDWDKVKRGVAYRGGSGYCYGLYAKELKANCVRQYRQDVIDCVTDSECEAADNNLLDCVNNQTRPHKRQGGEMTKQEAADYVKQQILDDFGKPWDVIKVEMKAQSIAALDRYGNQKTIDHWLRSPEKGYTAFYNTNPNYMNGRRDVYGNGELDGGLGWFVTLQGCGAVRTIPLELD